MSANNNTKAMDEVLQAAVARINRSDGGGGSGGLDPIGLLAAVLPKFLENRGEREDILEKVESLHTENLVPLREELRLARQQIHRLRKAQDEMLAHLRLLSEQQTAIGDAVLHLADQMSRLEFVEPVQKEPRPPARPTPSTSRRVRKP